MKTKRFYLLVVPMGVVVGALVLGLFRQRDQEPDYGGRKLSEWVQRYNYGSGPNSQEAAIAMRAIGIDAAFPHFLRWVNYTTPGWKHDLYGLLDRTDERII